MLGVSQEVISSFSNSGESSALISIQSKVEPWGQIKTPRAAIKKAGKSKEDGGLGIGEEFWASCEEEVRPYL